MRNEMGLLLVEDEKGEVAVQLFAEITGVQQAFKNLNGSPADKPRRATFVSFIYGEGGSVNVSAITKVFPQIESIEDRPDGYMLGEGPVKFSKQT